MKNDNETMKAESAVNLLRDGVTSGNLHKIVCAIDNATDVNWDEVEVIKMEWDDLLVEAENMLNDNIMETISMNGQTLTKEQFLTKIVGEDPFHEAGDALWNKFNEYCKDNPKMDVFEAMDMFNINELKSEE